MNRPEWATGFPEPPSEPVSLGGLFFHSRPVNKSGNREIEWQGQVLRRINNDTFLVELYSWITGCATNKVVVTMARIVEEEWKFFEDVDDWARCGNTWFEQSTRPDHA
jgi:hypothetical protein